METGVKGGELLGVLERSCVAGADDGLRERRERGSAGVGNRGRGRVCDDGGPTER